MAPGEMDRYQIRIFRWQTAGQMWVPPFFLYLEKKEQNRERFRAQNLYFGTWMSASYQLIIKVVIFHF